MSDLTWEDLSEIRLSIHQNKRVDDEKIISLVDSVSHLWNKLLAEKHQNEQMKQALEHTRTGISNAYEFGYLKETDEQDVHKMLDRINETLKGGETK